MKLTPTTLIAALVVIGTGGFLIGKISSTPQATIAANELAPTEARSTRGEDSATKENDIRTRRTEKLSPAARLARLEAIIRGEQVLDRNRALLAFIDQLAPADFEAAISHFRSLGLTEERMGEYALLLTAWAAVDPLSALAYSKEKTEGDYATDTILTTWATADPEAAIRWANANFSGPGANPYLAGIIRGIAETDPARATTLLTSMPKSVERAKGLDAMIPQLIRQGNVAAYAWIASLKDEALKEGAIERVAEPLAELDPKGTIAWLGTSPGEKAHWRIDDVFENYVHKDPQGALSTFQGMPKGRDRSNALSGLVVAKAATSPRDGLALMNQYPEDITNRVVQEFIWNSFEKDTATAMSQVYRITDEGQRNRMYERGMEAWIDSDAKSAQAFLNTNTLPPAIQQKMVARLSKN